MTDGNKAAVAVISEILKAGREADCSSIEVTVPFFLTSSGQTITIKGTYRPRESG